MSHGTSLASCQILLPRGARAARGFIWTARGQGPFVAQPDNRAAVPRGARGWAVGGPLPPPFPPPFDHAFDITKTLVNILTIDYCVYGFTVLTQNSEGEGRSLRPIKFNTR